MWPSMWPMWPFEKRIVKEYGKHVNEANSRYALKAQDKKKENKKKTVYLCGASSNAQHFYSLKLWTFNYKIIKDTSKDLTICCMWLVEELIKLLYMCFICTLTDIDDVLEQLTICFDNYWKMKKKSYKIPDSDPLVLTTVSTNG